jgi:hypothetical protein
MKNFKNVSITTYLMWLFSLILFSSCSNNNDDESISTGAPVITSVVKSGYDLAGNVLPLTPVAKGDPKNYYIIRGTGFTTVKKIYFNDYDTYFGSSFVTDTEIIVLIDEKTPYANASNKLKVVTENGTVLYDFVIAPPSPTLIQFNPVNAAVGDEITIYGKYFLNPIVTLAPTATLPAIPVTIVSSTLEKIVIKVPANANNRKISVTNISGTATSVDAIGSAIYDDKFYFLDGGVTGGWGVSNVNLANTTAAEVAQGTKAIKFDINAWSGFQADMWSNSAPVPAGAKGFRFKMKSNVDCKLAMLINGDWGHQVPFSITTKYADYVVTWADLGLTAAPTSIGQFTVFNNGTNATLCLDDIGFQL